MRIGAALFLLLCMSHAPVIAQVTSLTASPSIARIGQAVSFTIGGTGGAGCVVELQFDDGDVFKVEDASLPLTVSHRYSRPGKFAPSVFGGGSCFSIDFFATVDVSSKAVGPLSLVRVELRFENGRGEITVPKDTPDLKAFAIINYAGNGILKARWEVDGRLIQIVRKSLAFGGRTVLETPDIPRIPTFRPGLHRITLRFENPVPTFEIPTINYFVVASTAVAGEVPGEPTIELISPPARFELPRPGMVFSWLGVEEVAQYLVEIKRVGEDKPVVSALVTKTQYGLPRAYFRKLDRGRQYRWQVKAKDAKGNVVAVSQTRTFTWSPEPRAGTFFWPSQLMARNANNRRKITTVRYQIKQARHPRTKKEVQE